MTEEPAHLGGGSAPPPGSRPRGRSCETGALASSSCQDWTAVRNLLLHTGKMLYTNRKTARVQ